MSPRARKTATSPNRFLQVLHHMGWSVASLGDPQPLALAREHGGATWQAIPLPDGQILLLVFLEKALPDLDSAFKAYEDFLPLHAAIGAAFRQQKTRARHAVLIDGDANAQLIDYTNEDVLLDLRGERDQQERLLPLLNLGAVARGALENFPRKPLSQRARELDDWSRHWSNRLGATSGSNVSTMRQFFFWLHLARLVEKLELGPPRKVTFGEYSLSTRRPNAARYLDQVFRPLKENWNLLQGHSLATQKLIAEKAHEAGILEGCLDSYGRVSRGKFSSEVFSDAFADEELRLAGWRHALVERVETSGDDPGRWLAEPIVVNLDDVGFQGLIRQYGAIVEDLRKLAREQAVARERGVRTGLQMDVFGGEPPEVAEEEAPRLALQVALRVRTARADRTETTRMVLLANCAEWSARLRRPEPVFPSPHIMTIRPGGQVLPSRPELN